MGSGALVRRSLDERVRAGAAETDGDSGEHDDGEHTRADKGGRVLGQHRSGLQADLGQRDEQRQRGRGEQHHLDPSTHGQVAPIEEQGGEATDDEEQDEEDDQARR